MLLCAVDRQVFAARCYISLCRAAYSIGELVTHVREGKGHSFLLFPRKEKTEQFLYRDLFEEGDVWCRSGDLLERDPAGFLYAYGSIGTGFPKAGKADAFPGLI